VVVAQDAQHVLDALALHGEQQLAVLFMHIEQVRAERLAQRVLQPVDLREAGCGM